MLKKLLIINLSFLIIFSFIGAMDVEAYDEYKLDEVTYYEGTIPKEITMSEFEKIKGLAIKQGKAIDIDEYENDLQNAKTEKDKFNVIEKYSKYAVEDNVDTLSRNNSKASIGDIRIYTYHTYGYQDDIYSQKSGYNMSSIAYDVISLAAGWKSPVPAVFMTVASNFFPATEYGQYSNILISSLHDYVITFKEAQIWNGIFWEPMVISSKKNTNGHVLQIYYDGDRKKQSSEFDIGLVRIDTGLYFNDDATLKRLAKNTTSPISFSYDLGTITHYQDISKFRGWKKSQGKWYYLTNAGHIKTGWLMDNNKWYYLNISGIMQTGWLKDAGKWYYLNVDGSMVTGWKYVDSKWYYMDSSGVMATNTVIDGWKIDENGVAIKIKNVEDIDNEEENESIYYK